MIDVLDNNNRKKLKESATKKVNDRKEIKLRKSISLAPFKAA